MLIKTKFSCLGQEVVKIHQSGETILAAFDVIKTFIPDVKCVRDVSNKKFVAESHLGYEVEIKVISSRKLPNS